MIAEMAIPDSFQIQFMNLALDQARLALQENEVPVGCVFVEILDDGKRTVFGNGYNRTNQTRNGTRHAEIVAIDDIIISQRRNMDVFRNSELYVTCEPCIMCAAALQKLGIKHVYFGCANEKFGGTGSVLSVHISNSSGYGVTPYILREHSIELFRLFYSQENERAPAGKRKHRGELKKIC